MKTKFLHKRKTAAGFTLIEMMVAVSIFAIVAMITSGSFIIMADLYRKVQTNRAVIDNLNLAMDTMALQIREGRNYDFSCNGGVSCIAFDELSIETNQLTTNRHLFYKLEDSRLVQCVGTASPADCQALTSPEITVDGLEFFRDDSLEVPRVTVVLSGVATSKVGLSSDFLLQTTLSQRNYPR